MIAGNREIDQEIPGEQVPSVSGRILVGKDEDVRKWRGRVADVHALLEGVEQIPDPSVHGGGILIVTVANRSGIHRRIVGLVIDHEGRDVGYRVPRSHGTQ